MSIRTRNVFKRMRPHMGDTFRPVSRPNVPFLVNAWARYNESGDSGICVWVFAADAEETERQIYRLTDPRGWGTNSVHDCSGRWFAWAARFVSQGDRTFVVQRVFCDV